ncbi:hypothetical protein DFH06DRAFT_1351640 [Mycena polygramma]|nr:hypothetical protein DFH06DRAFT_1351640 [Mycena polygramma]
MSTAFPEAPLRGRPVVLAAGRQSEAPRSGAIASRPHIARPATGCRCWILPRRQAKPPLDVRLWRLRAPCRNRARRGAAPPTFDTIYRVPAERTYVTENWPPAGKTRRGVRSAASRAFAYTVRRSAARQASTLCIDFRRVAGAVCVHAFQASIFGLPSTVVALPATFMASQRRHSPPATYRIPMGQQKPFQHFWTSPSRHLTAADLARATHVYEAPIPHLTFFPALSSWIALNCDLRVFWVTSFLVLVPPPSPFPLPNLCPSATPPSTTPSTIAFDLDSDLHFDFDLDFDTDITSSSPASDRQDQWTIQDPDSRLPPCFISPHPDSPLHRTKHPHSTPQPIHLQG